jgi:hypothetical protein
MQPGIQREKSAKRSFRRHLALRFAQHILRWTPALLPLKLQSAEEVALVTPERANRINIGNGPT